MFSAWLLNNRTDFGSAEITILNFLRFFFFFYTRTALLALAGVDSLFCSFAGVLISAGQSSLLSNCCFFICSSKNGFLWTTPAILPVFLSLILYLLQ